MTRRQNRITVPLRTEKPAKKRSIRLRQCRAGLLCQKQREDGVVLIALLWLLVALSLLAMNLASEVRTEASLARSSGDSEKAYFLARGALEQVVYRLSFPDKEEEKQKSIFPFSDGMNHFWLKDGQMVCHVAILDEGGKLDLNHASEKILRKLLDTLGIENARSKALARSIVQWREADKSSGSQLPDDRAAQAIPQKFTSIEELLLVGGMTREILYGGFKKQTDGKMRLTRGLADFVTVYSDQGQVNVNYAEPEILASLPEIDLDQARLIVGARKSRPFDSGSALSQRIPGTVRGEALSSLSTQLSRTYCLVATAFPVGSKLRRSIMTVVRTDSAIKTRHEKLIWYDEYWPSEHLLRWIDTQTASPTLQSLNAGKSRQGWKSKC